MHGKADVPKVSPSHQHQWVRLADSRGRRSTHAKKANSYCNAHHCVSPTNSPAACTPLICVSAADAFADMQHMGFRGVD